MKNKQRKQTIEFKWKIFEVNWSQLKAFYLIQQFELATAINWKFRQNIIIGGGDCDNDDNDGGKQRRD